MGENLQSDCRKCFGLCCAALYFSASEGFPLDKGAGMPCLNLQTDFRCLVHRNLRQLGFKGCTVFECFGAGQKVSQYSFGGHSWQESPESADKMFAVFQIMRQLHELLWYLTEAMNLKPAHLIHDELRDMLEKTEHITKLTPDDLLNLDIAEYRAEVNSLLLKTSEYVRGEACSGQKPTLKRRKTLAGKVDLIGRDLKNADLRGENLRGAYLIAADLRGANLSGTDLIGADFRDADIRGADLSRSIFLTQVQINAAKGDNQTKIPSSLTSPIHWEIAK